MSVYSKVKWTNAVHFFCIIAVVLIVSICSHVKYTNKIIPPGYGDVSRYLASGVYYLNNKAEMPDYILYAKFCNGINDSSLLRYPNIFFQLALATPTKYLFNDKISYSQLGLFGVGLIFATNILIYCIARKKLSSIYSLCGVAALNTIPIFALYSDIASKNSSDAWLLMFVAMVVLLAMDGRYFLSGCILSIAYFFRSQAILFALPVLIVFKNYKLTSVVKFFLGISFCFLVTVFFLKLWLGIENASSSGSFFYRFYFYYLNVQSVLINTINTWRHLVVIPLLHVYILILPIFWVTISKAFSPATRRLSLFTIVVTMIIFIGCVIMEFSSSGQQGPRYFAYGVPFLALTIFFAIKDIICSPDGCRCLTKAFSSTVTNKMANLLPWALMLSFVIYGFYGLNYKKYFDNTRTEDVPDLVVDLMGASNIVMGSIPLVFVAPAFGHPKHAVLAPANPDIFFAGQCNDGIDAIVLNKNYFFTITENGMIHHGDDWESVATTCRAIQDAKGNTYWRSYEKDEFSYSIFQHIPSDGLDINKFKMKNGILCYE